MNTDIEMTSDQEYTMPCAEALMAGTLALMTGHVQACCDGHRDMMAHKIVANLSTLSEHPLLSPPFKAVLWNLRTRWQLQAEQGRSVRPAEQDQRLWHSASASVQ